MRTQGDINVNYTEVLILRPDGSEIEADFLLKDADLDLAFIRPQTKDSGSDNSLSFQNVQFDPANIPTIQALDEVVSLGTGPKPLS